MCVVDDEKNELYGGKRVLKMLCLNVYWLILLLVEIIMKV